MEEPIEDESGRYLNKPAKDGLPARAVGSWARTKLKMLSTYMDLFTVGMKPTEKKKHNWSKLAYIDLFAGPGKCIVRKTEEEIDGSPLLALHTPNWKFQKLYFVEAQPWASDALEKRTKADSRRVVLKHDCNTAVDEIIKKREPNTLYLAFIDPTGLDIHFSTIEALARQLQCDLLINWFMSAFPRNLQQWRGKGKSEKLTAFFGTEDWKQIVEKPVNRVVFRDLVELYRSQLEKIGYRYQGDPYSIKNSKQAVMYWLWFASRHSRGLDFWKKTVKSVDPQGTLF